MEIEFDFYDLAVIPGLFANGTAEISVRPDGVNDDPEWFIGKIYLHGENNKPREISHIDGTAAEFQIYMAIYDRLENDREWSDKINNQIASELLECVA